VNTAFKLNLLKFTLPSTQVDTIESIRKSIFCLKLDDGKVVGWSNTLSWRKNEPSTSFSTQNFVAIVDMLRNSLRTLPWVSKILTQFEKDYQDLKANEAPPKKKRVYNCSNCGVAGHNRNKCPHPPKSTPTTQTNQN